jgi:signal transduction histidine kinase
MFRLLRYFSLTSFVIILVVSVLLGFFYRRIILQDLVELGENKNVVLTQAFTNSLWPQFAPFVASVAALSPEVLREHPEIARLRHAVLALMQGLSVIKVKVYNLEGLTVFSTEASQIGENKSTNAGFRAARAGTAASELTHRKTFSAFESMIEDRDVLSSYIPIRRGALTDPIEGVFELYADITPLLAHIERTQKRVVMAVIMLLAALYAGLFCVVRHADRIIRRQHKALQEAHDTLEARVDERTAALVEANDRLQDEVAERKLIATALTQARDAALQAVQLKSEFLDNMSHEIRTPMNGIMGMTELLLETSLTAEQQEYADLVRMSAENLLTLINDILDFSKIEAGQLTLRTLDFSLHPVVQGVRDFLAPHAQAKHLTLTACIADDVPALMYGDAVRLRQVLLNLVGNAIKFTAQGEVTVSVAHEGEPSTPAMVRFTVCDTGIGIAKTDQPRLFQAFVQVDGSSTRQYGGTGLGLAMCKRLVELMDGVIGFESVPGQGSTFWFTLPCAQDPDEAMATFVCPQGAVTVGA